LRRGTPVTRKNNNRGEGEIKKYTLATRKKIYFFLILLKKGDRHYGKQGCEWGGKGKKPIASVNEKGGLIAHFTLKMGKGHSWGRIFLALS